MVVLISICPSSINFSIEALIKEAFIPLSIVKKNAGITRNVGPNISGRTVGRNGFPTSGCFYLEGSYSGWEGTDPNQSTMMDASRSNVLYGGSETVQPPSMLALACIKT